MPRGTDLDAVTVRGSSNSFRISNVVNMLEYPSKNGKPGWVTIRLFGPVYSDAFFWAKAKKGSNKSFRVQCRCYDPDSHQCLPEKYDPWYDEYRRECDEKIAQKLKIPEGTVKSRINNARKILKEKLSFLMKEEN